MKLFLCVLLLFVVGCKNSGQPNKNVKLYSADGTVIKEWKGVSVNYSYGRVYLTQNGKTTSMFGTVLIEEE